MTETSDIREFQSQLQRLEGLIRQVERLPDPMARARTQDIVQALLDLHGRALGRLLGHVAATGEAGRTILDACAADEMVGGLLLLHGLHPHDLADRVRDALDQLRPRLRTHENVELLGIENGVVQLHLDITGSDRVPRLRQMIEEVITAAVPDVAAIDIEGFPDSDPNLNGHSRVALPVL